MLTISYAPATLLLELHAPAQWLAEQKAGTEAMDLETLAQRAAQEASRAVGVPVFIEARYVLRGGLEMVVCVRS